MPDFSKIWATNSPLPEFSFTDEQYLEGWDFVDAAPPTKNQFDAWFKATDEKLKWLYDQLQNTASKVYPVGAVYISFNSANPATLFGGVWERLKDTFLLANGDAYAPNTSGGSATKTIGVENIPSHNHSMSAAGVHSHSVTVNRDLVSGTPQTDAVFGDQEQDGKNTLGTNSAGSHTHEIGNTGGDLPLNIMPPYKTVYVWRRTA